MAQTAADINGMRPSSRLTKREDIAKAAMVAIISNPAFMEFLSGNIPLYVPEMVAVHAKYYADALLLELSEQPPPCNTNPPL